MKITLNLTISDEELIRTAWENTPLGRSTHKESQELTENCISGDLGLINELRSHGFNLIGRSIHCPNEIQEPTTHFYLFHIDSLTNSTSPIFSGLHQLWDEDIDEIHIELLNMDIILVHFSVA